MPSKQCTSCKKIKDYDSFYKAKRGVGNRYSKCKECCSDRAKKTLELKKKTRVRTVITKDLIKSLYDFDERNGVFYKKDSHEVAGYVREGYRLLFISDWESISCHRLAWFMYYGSLPNGNIDHIDHDRQNNTKENLRDVTVRENARNAKLYSTNKSGFNGVRWCSSRMKWVVSVSETREGKKIGKTLGRFNCLLDAVARRLRHNRDNGFHKNHGK